MTEDFLIHTQLYNFVFTVETEREVWKEAVEIERPFSIPLNGNALSQEVHLYTRNCHG